MRIAFFADKSCNHGHKWISEIAKSNEVILITDIGNPLKNLYKDNPSIKIFEILPNAFPLKNIFLFLKTIFSIRKILRKHDVEIVHSMYAVPFSFWPYLAGAKKHIVTTRGSDVLIDYNKTFKKNNNSIQKITNYIFRTIFEKALAKADFIFPTSYKQKKIIETFVDDRKKINVLRTGVKIENFKERYNNSSLKESEGLTIFSNRALAPLYNIDIIIDGLKLLIDKNEKLKFKLIQIDYYSDLEYTVKIKNKIKELNLEKFVQIIETQDSKSLEGIYKISDIVIMCPSSDGTPVTAIEAMLTGKPLITGNIGYDEDIINPKHTWQLKNITATAIAEAITEIINTPKEEIEEKVDKAYQNALEKGDFNKEIGKLRNYYTLLGSPDYDEYGNIFKLKGNLFLKDLLTIFSGTLIAQLIPVLLSPILSRIYSPSEYGILAIFISITGILNVVINSQYTHGIIIAKTDEDAKKFVAISLFINFFYSLILLAPTILFDSAIERLYNNSSIIKWLYFIPISVFLNGFFYTLSTYLNRKKEFSLISKNRVVISATASITQLFLGFYIQGEFGLIMSIILSQTIGSIMILFAVQKRAFLSGLKKLKAVELSRFAKDYKNLILYLLPADFINVVTNQIPIFLFSKFSSLNIVGHYSFSQRTIGIPISLISASVVEVFKQKASSDYNEKGNCRKVYISTFKLLFCLSIIPSLIIFFFAPSLFAFVFGEEWREAGEYAKLLSPLFFFRFISSPLSYIYYIAQKQKEDFIIHVYMAISTFTCIYIAINEFHNIKLSILLFSLNYSTIYIYYLIRSYQLSLGNKHQK